MNSPASASRRPLAILAVLLVLLGAALLYQWRSSAVPVPESAEGMGRLLGERIQTDLPDGGRIAVLLDPAPDRVIRASQDGFVRALRDAAGPGIDWVTSREQSELTGYDAHMAMRGKNRKSWAARISDALDETGPCDAAVIQIPIQMLPRSDAPGSYPAFYVIDLVPSTPWKPLFESGLVRALLISGDASGTENAPGQDEFVLLPRP